MDPFVLDQLQAGNFLVRQTTFELSNLSIYVLANDHSKSKKSRKVKVKLIVLHSRSQKYLSFNVVLFDFNNLSFNTSYNKL